MISSQSLFLSRRYPDILSELELLFFPERIGDIFSIRKWVVTKLEDCVSSEMFCPLFKIPFTYGKLFFFFKSNICQEFSSRCQISASEQYFCLPLLFWTCQAARQALVLTWPWYTDIQTEKKKKKKWCSVSRSLLHTLTEILFRSVNCWKRVFGLYVVYLDFIVTFSLMQRDSQRLF